MWYYESNGAQQGPVEEAEVRDLIKRGTIGRGTRVWKEGMADWIPAGDSELVLHLDRLSPRNPQSPASPPPLGPVGPPPLTPASPPPSLSATQDIPGHGQDDTDTVKAEDMKFPCPHCESPLRVPVELAGEIGDCAGCGREVRIPSAGDPTTLIVPSSNPLANGLEEPKQPVMETEWYYDTGGDQQGPIEDQEFRSLISSGGISKETRVWKEGMDEWLTISATELVTALPKAPPPSLNPGTPPSSSSFGAPPPIASQPVTTIGTGGSECPVKGWCWAAALWGWIWQLKYGGVTWEGFVPFRLGSTGYEQAWKSRAWDSVDSFLATQRKWVKFWVIGMIASISLLLVSSALGAGDCRTCDGQGIVRCMQCGGKGQVSGLYGRQRCWTCNGQGGLRCGACYGSGKSR